MVGQQLEESGGDAATARGAADDVANLLAFLRDRDTPCPVCRYNLRNLEEARCPECRQPLALTVGVVSVRFGWLVALLVPSMFSGIAAAILLIPIIGVPLSGNPGAPWFVYALDAFGWCSGVFGLTLYLRRYWFLRQCEAHQQIWTLCSWGVHVGLFILLLVLVI